MHVVVGIGYPKRFYQSLLEIGVANIMMHEFLDHYSYTYQDLQFNDTYPIITTEKDAVKIKVLLINQKIIRPIWVLPVNAVLSESCYSVLKTQLSSVNISI